jgi:hypothetical protein
LSKSAGRGSSRIRLIAADRSEQETDLPGDDVHDEEPSALEKRSAAIRSIRGDPRPRFS